jgi:DNA-binding transcriptional MerR regulator
MISETANLVDVDSHVLRYWEDELGLIIPRNELGHRYYTEENLEQFRKIKEWKERGYQLKAIRMLVQESRMAHLPDTVKDEPKRAGGNQMVPKDKDENLLKLEQFQRMMKEIVKEAMIENTPAFGKEFSYQVGDKILKEMNYLMREQDEAEEERFRKLDAVIRSHGKGKKMKVEKAEKSKTFLEKRKDRRRSAAAPSM